MQIKRAIEVWEKGMDGAFVGNWPVADTVSVVWLRQLFVSEQQRTDDDMVLSYFLTADKLPALQPYVAQQLDPAQYDFILTAFGVPNAQPNQPSSLEDEDEPFD